MYFCNAQADVGAGYGAYFDDMLAGSIGIGGLQAGVVTIDQPSGFNFIGWTPLSIYSPESSPPSRLNAGDRLIFREITANQADDFKGKKPEPIVIGDDRLP